MAINQKYLDMMEAQARKSTAALDREQQKKVVQIFKSAGEEMIKKLKSARNNTATQAMRSEYVRIIHGDLLKLIQEYGIKSAEVPLSTYSDVMSNWLGQLKLDTRQVGISMTDLVGSLSRQSIENIVSGSIYSDGKGLSQRIWGYSVDAGNDLQSIVAACMAQHMGASEMSKVLQAYVDPNVRRTWDNEKIKKILGDGYATWNKSLEYNALRLARTTLAHAATLSLRQSAKLNPYMKKIMWHSVHAANRTCQICVDMDGKIYNVDECPFDHPNGLCYQTAHFDKSLNEISDELADWVNGESNDLLDDWWKEVNRQ